jgi:hypothetical protein
MSASNNRDDADHSPRTYTATDLPRGFSLDITPTADGLLPAGEVDTSDVRLTFIISNGVSVEVPLPDKPLSFLVVARAAGSGPQTYAAALPPGLSFDA